MKYRINFYPEKPGDLRREVTVLKDSVWILYIPMGGCGSEIRQLFAGDVWREGADELHRVFSTYDEAKAELDRL